MPLLQVNERGETLYAACIEFYNSINNTWRAETKHFHAIDNADANFKIKCAYPDRRRVRVVSVAPAIGFHVEDEHGDRLRA